jgi:hypothetical protein
MGLFEGDIDEGVKQFGVVANNSINQLKIVIDEAIDRIIKDINSIIDQKVVGRTVTITIPPIEINIDPIIIKVK